MTNDALNMPKTDATKLSKIEAQIANVSHAKKIADAMAPDCKVWAYEGGFADAGPSSMAACTCGHPIRYVFTIVNTQDGRSLPIGSTCIEETVPVLIAQGAEGLAEKLAAALAAHRAALAAAKAKIRDAANDEVVAALLAERDALLSWVKTIRNAGAFLARPLFDLLHAGAPKAASTPGRTAAALRTSLAVAFEAAALTVHPPVTAPSPKDAALENKVIAALLEGKARAEAQGQANSAARYSIALEKVVPFDAADDSDALEAEMAEDDEHFAEMVAECETMSAPLPPAPAPKAAGFAAPRATGTIRPTVADLPCPF